ncbi:hypothetical protein ACL7TT_06895 [Microbulbifer sp. 2304DJ12-6]|uniref:hypothetical protein n=1 Tax=Microbulbifer sp. 2304DJ12-6 TaxID=3233340 RepID=UPI0039B009E7
MQNMSKQLFLSVCLSFVATETNAAETIAINPISIVPLLDGRCGNDEWQAATKIELPAQASIYLLHDKDYFYICAKGKAEDITVLDLYIEHTETGNLHKFHLSAQMGESVLTDKGWEGVSGKWILKDYAGFWVPYSGLEDPENRKGPKWAKGTHRQVQVSRNKFPGNTWNMMFGVSAINHEGNWNSEFFYPEKAVATDKSTWRRLSLSE